jgi:hypothetical protein
MTDPAATVEQNAPINLTWSQELAASWSIVPTSNVVRSCVTDGGDLYGRTVVPIRRIRLM